MRDVFTAFLCAIAIVLLTLALADGDAPADTAKLVTVVDK